MILLAWFKFSEDRVTLYALTIDPIFTYKQLILYKLESKLWALIRRESVTLL